MVILDTNYKNISDHLEYLLGKDLFNNKKVDNCPHCDSYKIIKYGSYKNGQRYMCKMCGRTFCKRTFTPFYYSKKTPSLWMKYIELMLQNNTLRECSEKLEINIGTSFYWRHKLLNTLMQIREPNKLNSYIEMAKIFMKENFKGSRRVTKIERETIWTIIASDSEDKVIARPICKSRWDSNAFNKIIYSRIDSDSYIIGHGDRFLWSIERKHNKGKKIVEENNILKSYYLEIKRSMMRYYGVASKYLVHYLYWITIFCVKQAFDSVALLYRLISMNSYIKNKEFKEINLGIE